MTDLERVVEALAAGEVVGVPTDTVYGLAVDACRDGASARLFAAKRRPESVALPVLVPDIACARSLAAPLPPAAEMLMTAFWPGPLTLVVTRARSAALDLGGDPSTIGMRCPSHPTALELLRRSGALAVTSANLHGQPPLTTAPAVRAAFGERLGVVLDGGPCTGTPSTVVCLAGGVIELLRAGAVPFSEVLATAHRAAART